MATNNFNLVDASAYNKSSVYNSLVQHWNNGIRVRHPHTSQVGRGFSKIRCCAGFLLRSILCRGLMLLTAQWRFLIELTFSNLGRRPLTCCIASLLVGCTSANVLVSFGSANLHHACQCMSHIVMWLVQMHYMPASAEQLLSKLFKKNVRI